MRLLSLSLRNYRNYSRLDLEPGAHLNVFLGANGQGKTNLLESVAILALSSSPRARREMELVGPVAGEARIEAVVEGGGRRSEVRISIVVEGEQTRRRIEVDGSPRRAVDLPGLFRVSLFWPDDLNLVKSGPDHRRRLLNQLLVQVETGYAASLGRYARVIEQRNSLLKQIWSGEQRADALDVWDLETARLGEQLVMARATAVDALNREAAASHQAISRGEVLQLQYHGPPPGLLSALQAGRAGDLRRGLTGVGPHRDDVQITLDGRDARAFASQGQQRTAVVSIKLAEAAVLAARTGEPPVLLLDDVLSELDADRRRDLLAKLGEPGQVIITSVEADPFPEAVIVRSEVRCISRGAIVACG